jgi:hypothetical protein
MVSFSVTAYNTLLKRTDKGAGPSGLAVISLQKVDSLLVFDYNGS